MTVYDTHARGAYADGYAEAEQAAPLGRAVVPLVNWTGAMASLALVAGLGLWGYNLAMRDVAGIPVIQALEGPMRVQPDDPGGRQADHQGLAVNAVQADGIAAAPVDQITLAPRPIDLSTATPARDVPAVVTSPAAVPSASANAANVALTTDDADASEATGLAVDALINTLVAEEEAVSEDLVPASQPGVALSPRPAARPATSFASRAVMDTSSPLSAQPLAYVDPATLVDGTRMVQFGAFDDEHTARTEWDRISGLFGDYMQGKAPVIQQAERAGRSFYRLRATGFEDMADARRFCSVFLAENMACIPVVYK